MQSNTHLATIGGGCFWCLEKIFELVQGVTVYQSGYSGDSQDKAVYSKVCSGTTKHAEVVQITFTDDISFTKLLQIFFHIHDPTTMNNQQYLHYDGQGADEGTQYRSIIFYHDGQQKQDALDYIKQLNETKIYSGPIVTQVVQFESFYPCEKDHDNYYNLNPNEGYCRGVIDPKIQKLFEKYSDRIKPICKQ